MTDITSAPALLTDLSGLQPLYSTFSWRRLVVQFCRSEAATLRAGSRVAAVVGLYPQDGWRECWFLAARDLREDRLAPLVLLKARRLLAARVGRDPICAGVVYGNPTGERIAQAMGFRPDGDLIPGVLKRFTIDNAPAGVISTTSAPKRKAGWS